MPKGKKLATCLDCGEAIAQGDIRFRWCPFAGGPDDKPYFHLNCAFVAGERGDQCSKVSDSSLRKAMGLSREQKEALDAALERDPGALVPAAKGKKSKLGAPEASTAPAAKKAKAPEVADVPVQKGTGQKETKGAEMKKPAAKAADKKVAKAAPAKLKAGADKMKAQQAVRVGDVMAEPLAARGPITGVMEVKRLPVREAAVATGVDDMDACGFLAAENGARLAEGDPGGLDADEAGALHLYTMESGLYTEMNARLRDCDRLKLRSFFPFLKLMLSARKKLPKFVGTVWRGVKADLRAAYPKGKELYWWAFASTTKELSTLTNPLFLGTKGVRTVFNIQVSTGVDIMRYSIFQGATSEAEVLLFPGTKLRVIDSMDMGNGLYQVHLQEVAVPVKLVK